MAKLNRKGNKRGTTPAQLEALARGREARRKKCGPPPDPSDPAEQVRQRGLREGGVVSRQRGGLTTDAAAAVATRIRKHIKALSSDPNLLGTVVAATMLADMEDANRFIKNAWNAVHKFLEGDGDIEADAPPGTKKEVIEAAKAAGAAGRTVLVLPIIDEIRKWSKLTAELALRVAEIHARTRGNETPDEYLQARYGETKQLETEPEDDDEDLEGWKAPVTFDELEPDERPPEE